jgi:cupin fold WbuC family metalloprotein
MENLESDQLDLVDAGRIAALCEAAHVSPRGRAHLLLHAGHRDQVQVLLIALEPATFVRAHKHSEQWEMLILLRGQVDILLLSDDAELRRRITLNSAAPVIQIPRLRCHCAVSLEPGSLVMEIKPGPYRPNEFMDWTPAEGSVDAGAFLAWARMVDIGDAWRG